MVVTASAGPAVAPAHRGFCVAEGLYRQSSPEFRVASSVEQLNIEVGARSAPPKAAWEGAGLRGTVQGHRRRSSAWHLPPSWTWSLLSLRSYWGGPVLSRCP